MDDKLHRLQAENLRPNPNPTLSLSLTLTLTLTLTLQAENLRLRTHHLRPGGVLFYFFLYPQAG